MGKLRSGTPKKLFTVSSDQMALQPGLFWRAILRSVARSTLATRSMATSSTPLFSVRHHGQGGSHLSERKQHHSENTSIITGVALTLLLAFGAPDRWCLCACVFFCSTRC